MITATIVQIAMMINALINSEKFAPACESSAIRSNCVLGNHSTNFTSILLSPKVIANGPKVKITITGNTANEASIIDFVNKPQIVPNAK